MGSDPAFLFYPGDWLGGTLGMTFEVKGAYIELLIMQFNEGHLPEKMIVELVGKDIWENIKRKFVRDEKGLFFNEKLQLEQTRRKEHSEHQKQRALDGWAKRKHKSGIQSGNAGALPLETETETETKTEDVTETENKDIDIIKDYFFKEFWLNYPNRGRRIGKEETLQSMLVHVKVKDLTNFKKAVKNYLESDDVENGFEKNPKRFIKNRDWCWRDWIEKPKEEKPGKEQKILF